MSVAAHDIIQQALEECHHGRIHPESVAAASLAPPVLIPALTGPHFLRTSGGAPSLRVQVSSLPVFS